MDDRNRTPSNPDLAKASCLHKAQLSLPCNRAGTSRPILARRSFLFLMILVPALVYSQDHTLTDSSLLQVREYLLPADANQMETCDDLGTPFAILDSSRAKAYMQKGAGPETLKYYKALNVLKDSLNRQERKRQLLAIQYEAKQKEQQIKTLQAEIKKSSDQKEIRLLLTVTLLGLLLGVLYISYNNQQSLDQELKRLKNDLDRQNQNLEKPISNMLNSKQSRETLPLQLEGIKKYGTGSHQ